MFFNQYIAWPRYADDKVAHYRVNIVAMEVTPRQLSFQSLNSTIDTFGQEVSETTFMDARELALVG